MKLNHDRNQANVIFFDIPETASDNLETSQNSWRLTLNFHWMWNPLVKNCLPAVSSLITKIINSSLISEILERTIAAHSVLLKVTNHLLFSTDSGHLSILILKSWMSQSSLTPASSYSNTFIKSPELPSSTKKPWPVSELSLLQGHMLLVIDIDKM